METRPLVRTNQQKIVMVVDDNPEILHFVAGLLVAHNYKVITAISGPDALHQSQDFKEPIDLLLTDFQMPGMSGIDLATEMSIARPQLQILMMSGFTGGMLVLNEGWHFLAKPFIPSQLLALIVGLVSPDRPTVFPPVNLN